MILKRIYITISKGEQVMLEYIRNLYEKCSYNGSLHRKVLLTNECYINKDNKSMEYLIDRGIVRLMMKAIECKGEFIITGLNTDRGMEIIIRIEPKKVSLNNNIEKNHNKE